MQVSDAKIKTDWEKLLEEKNSEQIIIKNKPSDKPHFPEIISSKIEKNQKKNSLILNYSGKSQPPKNLNFTTFFGASPYWQKQLFENLEIYQNVMSEFGKLCNAVMRETRVALDAYTRFSQIQSNMVSNSIEMYNNFLEQGLDWHSKFMSIYMKQK